MGKASTRASNKYNARVYDRLQLVIPKGRKADIQTFADANSTTVNALISDYLRQLLGMTPEEWKTRADSADTDDNQTTD